MSSTGVDDFVRNGAKYVVLPIVCQSVQPRIFSAFVRLPTFPCIPHDESDIRGCVRSARNNNLAERSRYRRNTKAEEVRPWQMCHVLVGLSGSRPATAVNILIAEDLTRPSG